MSIFTNLLVTLLKLAAIRRPRIEASRSHSTTRQRAVNPVNPASASGQLATRNFSFLSWMPAILAALFLSGCIGDDVIFDTVPEAVRILNPVDSISVGDTYQFEARYTNNVGQPEVRASLWSSSDTEVIAIDGNGRATAVAGGKATVSVEVPLDGKSPVSDAVEVVASEAPVIGTPPEERSGTIRTTSSYLLEGNFTLRKDGDGLLLEIGQNYRASSNLPGLYVYLANNPSTVNNALEIGRVETFSGAHSYHISGVGLNDYDYLLYWCKPFGVKVGEGQIE